jgi:hypothetical protein
MSYKKSFLVSTAFLSASLLGVSPANAQTPKMCYTLASIQGNYSVVGTYGANVGIALGIRNYDGNGNLTGTYVVNEPTAGSTTGGRTLITGTQAGTYTVNCNGTGTFNRVLSVTNGITTTQVDDFVITGAVLVGGQLIATSIVDAQEAPSAIVPGGIFLTRTHTRLPDAYF